MKVSVRNGTTVDGLAARAAASLTGSGFEVTDTVTAGSQDVTGTVIEFGPGAAGDARTVARLFPGRSCAVPTSAAS